MFSVPRSCSRVRPYSASAMAGSSTGGRDMGWSASRASSLCVCMACGVLPEELP